MNLFLILFKNSQNIVKISCASGAFVGSYVFWTIAALVLGWVLTFGRAPVIWLAFEFFDRFFKRALTVIVDWDGGVGTNLFGSSQVSFSDEDVREVGCWVDFVIGIEFDDVDSVTVFMIGLGGIDCSGGLSHTTYSELDLIELTAMMWTRSRSILTSFSFNDVIFDSSELYDSGAFVNFLATPCVIAALWRRFDMFLSSFHSIASITILFSWKLNNMRYNYTNSKERIYFILQIVLFKWHEIWLPQLLIVHSLTRLNMNRFWQRMTCRLSIWMCLY